MRDMEWMKIVLVGDGRRKDIAGVDLPANSRSRYGPDGRLYIFLSSPERFGDLQSALTAATGSTWSFYYSPGRYESKAADGRTVSLYCVIRSLGHYLPKADLLSFENYPDEIILVPWEQVPAAVGRYCTVLGSQVLLLDGTDSDEEWEELLEKLRPVAHAVLPGKKLA